jgi:hypothetical protein
MERIMPNISYGKPANMTDLAHRLALFGYNIVPIQIGRKGPTFANWQNYESTPDNINRDFPPQGIVIGVKHDRLGCVDVDVYDADLSAEIRDEFLRRFPRCLERVGQAPKTALVFRLPDEPYTISNTTKRKKKGVEAQVEIRTKTGQMVAYGKHPDTKQPYRWTRGELWETPLESLPMPPDWEIQEFRDWCEAKIRDWAEEGAQPMLAPVIDLGAYAGFSSNEPPTEEAVREALSYIPADLGYQDWLQVLMALHDYYNGSMAGLQVAQDWSSRYADYNAKEVDAKWRSFKGTGVKYSTLFHYAKTYGADLSELARKHRKREPFTIQLGHAPEALPEAKEAPRGALEWYDEINVGTSSSYIVKGFLADDSLSVIYGPSNSGKTFFAMDLAFHIAAGKEWRGRRVKQAAVLYLATEGGKGVQSRIVALRNHTGVHSLPFAVKRAGMDLLNSQADLQAIYDLSKAVRDDTGIERLVIVIDTLSRVMAGGDENSAQDMTALIKNIDLIREATNAHVILVHHTGKDTARGARGHSSLRAAVDTEIEVQVENDWRAAVVTKQRDFEGGQEMPFQLKRVSLGFDEEGDEITSCVVIESDEMQKKPRKLSKNQRVLVDVWTQLKLEGIGKESDGGPLMPPRKHFWLVPMDRFRQECEAKLLAKNTRDAFIRALDALLEGNAVFGMASGWVWKLNPTEKGINNNDL